ncbi:MAG: helix-turn-helix domain-containing protein [Cyanophyceae cyanobacterium]
MNKTPRDLQQEQYAILQELGARLHQLRTEKKISLVALANETKIQRRLLKAIEAGALEELPEPVYVRSFLKYYANTLGLDGDEFASAFPVEAEAQRHRYPLNLSLPFLRLRPFHLYFLYVLIVFASIRGLSEVVRRSSPQESQTQIVIVEPNPEPQTTRPPQPSLAVSSAEPNEPVVVDILLKDQCWLQVSADGETVFEGVLPKGTRRTWTAQEQVKLRAGNAGGVMVTYNDQQTQRLGDPGEVEEVTYQAPEL